MILKVANFTEEGLVTPEGVDQEGILKINLSMDGIEPQAHVQKVRGLTITLSGQDCIKVSCKIKTSISPPLQNPSLR